MDDPNVVEECFNQYLNPGVWGDVKMCVDLQGNSIMDENNAIVQGLKPKLSHVPWIVIGSEHSLMAEANLVNEICYAYYGEDKPAICRPPLVSVGVYYETVNTAVDSLFLQMAQYGEYLDEIGNFDFVPYGTTQNSGGQLMCQQTDQCAANTAHVSGPRIRPRFHSIHHNIFLPRPASSTASTITPR